MTGNTYIRPRTIVRVLATALCGVAVWATRAAEPEPSDPKCQHEFSSSDSPSPTRSAWDAARTRLFALQIRFAGWAAAFQDQEKLKIWGERFGEAMAMRTYDVFERSKRRLGLERGRAIEISDEALKAYFIGAEALAKDVVARLREAGVDVVASNAAIDPFQFTIDPNGAFALDLHDPRFVALTTPIGSLRITRDIEPPLDQARTVEILRAHFTLERMPDLTVGRHRLAFDQYVITPSTEQVANRPARFSDLANVETLSYHEHRARWARVKPVEREALAPPKSESND